LDFNNYFFGLSSAVNAISLAEAKKQGAVFAYGSFITVALNFIILAFIIFLMVKQMNKLKNEAPAAPSVTPEDVVLLREIRDALKAR
jgi:large conductance mechanosensitive channel